MAYVGYVYDSTAAAAVNYCYDPCIGHRTPQGRRRGSRAAYVPKPSTIDCELITHNLRVLFTAKSMQTRQSVLGTRVQSSPSACCAVSIFSREASPLEKRIFRPTKLRNISRRALGH